MCEIFKTILIQFSETFIELKQSVGKVLLQLCSCRLSLIINEENSICQGYFCI